MVRRWWSKVPKKITAGVIGVLVQLLPIPDGFKERIAELAMAFILGQGIADAGKERAKIEKETTEK